MLIAVAVTAFSSARLVDDVGERWRAREQEDVAFAVCMRSFKTAAQTKAQRARAMRIGAFPKGLSD